MSARWYTTMLLCVVCVCVGGGGCCVPVLLWDVTVVWAVIVCYSVPLSENLCLPVDSPPVSARVLTR